MQLVQPSEFFRQYWHARVRSWAMLLFLVTLKNFDVCTVTMGVACPLLYTPLMLHSFCLPLFYTNTVSDCLDLLTLALPPPFPLQDSHLHVKQAESGGAQTRGHVIGHHQSQPRRPAHYLLTALHGRLLLGDHPTTGDEAEGEDRQETQRQDNFLPRGGMLQEVSVIMWDGLPFPLCSKCFCVSILLTLSDPSRLHIVPLCPK